MISLDCKKTLKSFILFFPVAKSRKIVRKFAKTILTGRAVMPENPRARRLAPPTPEYFPTLGKQFYPNNSILFRFDPNNSIIFHFDQNNSILFQLDPNEFHSISM